MKSKSKPAHRRGAKAALVSPDTDPSGSYTGVNAIEPFSMPEQDADDL